MSLFFKPKLSLGVDLGAGGTKIIELRQEKHRPVLSTFGYTSLSDKDAVPLDNFFKAMTASALLDKKNSENARAANVAELYFTPEQVKSRAHTLKEVYRQCKARSKSAIVSLPSSAVFHAIVTVPVTTKDEFNSILRAEINKLLPMPLSEMMIDYQVVSKDTNQRVMVSAVPRSLVLFYSQIFAKAGLRLESLEPESTALARSLVGRDGSIAMIVDIGAQRTNFFIVDQGVPVTHHSVEIGGDRISRILSGVLGIEESAAEEVKFNLSMYLSASASPISGDQFLSNFSTVIDPIIKEIQYGIELYFRQLGNENKKLEKIILTGGGSFLPFLTDRIADQFKVRCYVGDPWARTVYQDGLRPLLTKIGPRMAAAIGLALRSMV